VKDFDNALKEASERYISKEFSKTSGYPYPEEARERIETILTTSALGRRYGNYRSLTKCLAAALLALLLLSSAVCAAVPEIRERFTDLLPGADAADSVWYEKLHTVCEYFDAAEEEAPPEAADIVGRAIHYFETSEMEEQPR